MRWHDCCDNVLRVWRFVLTLPVILDDSGSCSEWKGTL
jgi:hypothetical protein